MPNHCNKKWIVLSLFIVVVASQYTQQQQACRRIIDAYDAVCSNQAELYLLAELSAKIKQLEKRPTHCPIKYNEKCFWIEPRETKFSFEEGVVICESQGARVANIYSEYHYYMMLGYLEMFTSKTGSRSAWLAMTYDTQSGVVLLSNGTRAPFVKWRPNFAGNSGYNMAMNGRRDVDHQDRHMFRYSTTLRAVACEK